VSGSVAFVDDDPDEPGEIGILIKVPLKKPREPVIEENMEGIENMEKPESPLLATAPYLTIFILGIRFNLSRKTYDELPPWLRKLADRCMTVRKKD
jgi:hypothetical protein